MFSNMIFLSTTTLIHDHCPRRQSLLIIINKPNRAHMDLHGSLLMMSMLFYHARLNCMADHSLLYIMELLFCDPIACHDPLRPVIIT